MNFWPRFKRWFLAPLFILLGCVMALVALINTLTRIAAWYSQPAFPANDFQAGEMFGYFVGSILIFALAVFLVVKGIKWLRNRAPKPAAPSA